MVLYKAEAVVLRAEPFGESHRLVTLLTPAHGRLRAVAKGARRPVSRLAAALMPFTHCRLLLWQGRSLDGISQAEVCQSYRAVRADLVRMAAALYACELAGELVPERPESQRETAAAFRLMLAFLDLLATGGRPDLALRYCELHLLSLSGFRPRFDRCPLCGGPLEGAVLFSPAAGGCLCRGCTGHGRAGGVWLGAGAVRLAMALHRSRPAQAAALPVAPAVVDELAAALESHLQHVLDKRLKARDFWEAVRPRP